MPRLHKYRDRNACYVLTAIRGAMVTFQLTADGEKKLTAARIAPGQQFPRAILLDLYRTGDAFTGGTGVSNLTLDGVGQMELDFANDPDPESAFPSCDVCNCVNDLHLTITGKPEDLIAQIQCATCRALPGARPDTSIPTGLLYHHYFTATHDLHSLRVAGVSFLLDSGVPLAIVAQIAGHKSLAMTLHYYRAEQQTLRLKLQQVYSKLGGKQALNELEAKLHDTLNYEAWLKSTPDGFSALREARGSKIWRISLRGICPGTSCDDGLAKEFERP